MVHDLRLRLFLTYCAVTLAALVILGSVFTAVLTGAVSSSHIRELRGETASLADQLDSAFAAGARRAAIQAMIKRDSQLLGKRIILLDRAGRARFDSARWTPFSRGSWRMVDLDALRHGRWARLEAGGQLGLQSPLVVRGREVGAVSLVTTPGDTGIPWRQIVTPLAKALAALLLVWVIVSAIFARSLSLPLRRLSAGLLRAKEGEYGEPIPEQGWSEARSLARRYNEMVAEVARSRQAQRDFLASAAHELKTPVTLVAGFARALSDGTARREGAEDDAVEYIQTESAHLVHVVDELFALAKLDADAGALVPAPCRVEALLHATARRFAGASLSRGVAIEVDCGSHIPLCVWDEEQVTSALSNLLGNALEHAGSDTIAVRACVSEGGVTIEVEDWGRGIPPGDLPHIFDRFYRGQSRRGDGHAGLGLALVREIAERHGGSVSVRSGVAEGTCFALTLPLVPPTAADSRVTGSEMTA